MKTWIGCQVLRLRDALPFVVVSRTRLRETFDIGYALGHRAAGKGMSNDPRPGRNAA